MSVSLIIFGLIQISALLFLIETLRRTLHRSRELPMKDTSATLPFGFLQLRHIVTLYVVTYLAWLLFSCWLYFTLIHSIPTQGSVSPTFF